MVFPRLSQSQCKHLLIIMFKMMRDLFKHYKKAPFQENNINLPSGFNA